MWEGPGPQWPHALCRTREGLPPHNSSFVQGPKAPHFPHSHCQSDRPLLFLPTLSSIVTGACNSAKTVSLAQCTKSHLDQVQGVAPPPGRGLPFSSASSSGAPPPPGEPLTIETSILGQNRLQPASHLQALPQSHAGHGGALTSCARDLLCLSVFHCPPISSWGWTGMPPTPPLSQGAGNPSSSCTPQSAPKTRPPPGRPHPEAAIQIPAKFRKEESPNTATPTPPPPPPAKWWQLAICHGVEFPLIGDVP